MNKVNDILLPIGMVSIVKIVASTRQKYACHDLEGGIRVRSSADSVKINLQVDFKPWK